MKWHRLPADVSSVHRQDAGATFYRDLRRVSSARLVRSRRDVCVRAHGGARGDQARLRYRGRIFLALASGIGGGLIRDGVFIPGGAATPLLTDLRYVELIVAATVAGALFGGHAKKFHQLIATIDALGLGAYAAFGTEKALTAGLAVPAAVLVGVINAAGGGLLRDIITREEPLVFRPGQSRLCFSR